MQKAIIAIPIYKKALTKAEEASLKRCFKVFDKYVISFFGPVNLETEYYEQIAGSHSHYIERFPCDYFSSLRSYSRLLLNKEFYTRYGQYEYMLLYQLDAWVFRDELGYWCDRDYDHIGAPWFDGEGGYGNAVDDSPIIEHSANGGFSLRKISKFIAVFNKLDTRWWGFYYKKRFKRGSEDLRIAKCFPKISRDFKIAPANEAMRFSFETLPHRLYKEIGGLPFGCHAFEKHNWNFWKDHINIDGILD